MQIVVQQLCITKTAADESCFFVAAMQEATLLRANEAQMDRSTATALVECAGWEQQAGEIMQKGKSVPNWECKVQTKVVSSSNSITYSLSAVCTCTNMSTMCKM